MKCIAGRSLLLLSIALSGCAAPLVKYGLVTKPDEKGLTKFSFSESVIKFNFKKGPSPAFAIEGFDIVSVPVPSSDGKKYYIAGTSAMENWGVETKVVPAFRSDTDLLQSVSTEVTDKRISYIEKAGSVATKALGFFVSGQEMATTKLPNGISVQQQLKCTRQSNDYCKITFNETETKNYYAEIRVNELPVDAFPRPKSLESDTYNSGAFLYSACRQVDVRLYFTSAKITEKVAESTVMVADSDYVQTLAFPSKGKVTAGASCGATAANENAGLPNALDYVDALIGQAQAVAKEAKK